MSKVYFVTQNFYPEGGAAASRVSERLPYWEELDITVLTRSVQNVEVISPWCEKVTVLSLGKGFKGEGLIIRALNYLAFAVWAFFKLLFLVKSKDVVISSSPQFLTLPVGIIAAKLKSARFIAEIADLWPDTLVSLDVMSSRGLTYRLWKALEKWIYRHSDHIVALTPGIKKAVIKTEPLSNDKTTVIPNGFDENKWRGEKVKSLYSVEKFVFGYFGKIGYAQNLKILIEAAEQLRSYDEIQFIIAGEGVHYKDIEALVLEKKLTNVQMLGWVLKNKIQTYWSEVDCGLVFLKDKELFKGAIPSKLIECIGTETPILLSAPISDASDIVIKEKIGVVIQPEDTAALVKALKLIVEKKEKLKNYRKKLIECKDRYTRRQQAVAFLSVINKVRG